MVQHYFKRFIVPILWMGVIFFISAQPNLPQAGEGTWDTVFKKLAHLIEYALLSWLWQRALSKPQPVTTKPQLWAGGISLLYALTDEIHQTFVPNRHGQFSDVLIDALGILAGLWWFSLRNRLRRGVD